MQYLLVWFRFILFYVVWFCFSNHEWILRSLFIYVKRFDYEFNQSGK
nr:MAG TPA: hypothetical protein [Caudoviricetes sp.]DAY56472.1 MAG TPA: hypothetical protein [Caudoviricetes sp.]